MPNIVVVGAQWGDEGKGKVVDHLAAQSRWVVRFQGGNNAGHTLVVEGRRVILHLVPSGILQPGCTCVIGNGVVLDPAVLVRELETLSGLGVEVGPERLWISTEAHLILPTHRAIDQAREQRLGGRKIGTTGRGIGPAYEDKVGRRGVRVGDLADFAAVRERVESGLIEHNAQLAALGHGPLTVDRIVAELEGAAARLLPHARSIVRPLHQAWKRGESILFEGAQGTFLDVDHGTYPYVTSSNTVAGAACAGAGVGPTAIDGVVGIAKAYTTRVGSGPFPSELEDTRGERLRHVGNEYGATTGRPRRCGWFDAALVRHAVMVNGITELALTKLDVLSGMGPLQVAVAYEGLADVPAGAAALSRVRPVYETLSGWEEDISRCGSWAELPPACRAYVERIEALVGAPITMLGVGAGRESTILRAAR